VFEKISAPIWHQTKTIVFPSKQSAIFWQLCEKKHASLLVGQCPWCGRGIFEGRPNDEWRDFDLLFEGLRGLAAGKAKSSVDRPEIIEVMVALFEKLGRDTRNSVPILCAGLSHADASVRLAAVNALGRIGPPAKDSLPALRTLLEVEWAPMVRKAVESAIKQIELASD